MQTAFIEIDRENNGEDEPNDSMELNGEQEGWRENKNLSRLYSIFGDLIGREADTAVSWKVIKVDSQKDESICIPRYCIFMVS